MKNAASYPSLPVTITAYCVPRQITARAHYTISGELIAYEAVFGGHSKLFTKAGALVTWLRRQAGR